MRVSGLSAVVLAAVVSAQAASAQTVDQAPQEQVHARAGRAARPGGGRAGRAAAADTARRQRDLVRLRISGVVWSTRSRRICGIRNSATRSRS